MIRYDVITQGSVNHYLHHAKFNWNYGSRSDLQPITTTTPGSTTPGSTPHPHHHHHQKYPLFSVQCGTI